MTTIQIRKQTKKRLDAFADGRSMNKAMRDLLDNADVVEDIKVCKYEFVNIRIDDELYQKLKRCKIHTKESHSQVIERLLDDINQENTKK